MKVERLCSEAERVNIDEDCIKAISEWYHFVICELLRLPGVKSDAAWIAAKVGINVAQAEEALERLQNGSIKQGTLTGDSPVVLPTTKGDRRKFFKGTKINLTETGRVIIK